MTRLLLDTNAVLLLGFRSGPVSAAVKEIVAEAERRVSHVSAIEMAIKSSIGKLSLPPSFQPSFTRGFAETVRELEADHLPIEINHIDLMTRLPLHHRDPFDRLLIAQALAEDLTLVSRDRKFRLYAGLDLLEL